MPATVADPVAELNSERVQQFLDGLDVSPRTKRTYREALKTFARWVGTNGSALAPETVRAYRDWLRERRAANTVITYLVALRRFFDAGAARGWWPENVALGVRSVRKPRGHLRHDLSREQLRALFDAVDRDTAIGLRDFTAINLMARNGLRLIEVQRANVGDLERVQGRTILRVHGKGRDARDEFVVLSGTTCDIVERYLAARGPTGPTDPMFVGLGARNRGGRLTTRYIRRRITTYMQAAGVKTDKVSVHSLRHSFVTLAIEGGASLVEAQAAARHRSVQTTMVYFHEHGRLRDPVEDRIQI